MEPIRGNHETPPVGAAHGPPLRRNTLARDCCKNRPPLNMANHYMLWCCGQVPPSCVCVAVIMGELRRRGAVAAPWNTQRRPLGCNRTVVSQERGGDRLRCTVAATRCEAHPVAAFHPLRCNLSQQGQCLQGFEGRQASIPRRPYRASILIDNYLSIKIGAVWPCLAAWPWPRSRPKG